jgi:hypothetical protein
VARSPTATIKFLMLEEIARLFGANRGHAIENRRDRALSPAICMR